MQTLSANNVIQLMNLQPLAGEGGFFRETWKLGNAEHPDATAIYYLITPDSFSALHRLLYTEIFHFYAGDSCLLTTLDANGSVHSHRLGNDLAQGDQPQVVVPPDTWQATRLVHGGEWALMGTTMTPGFHVRDFELATEAHLHGLAPDMQTVLRSLLAE